MPATLEMILRSRDERQRMQRELLDLYPQYALVVATVVIPGAEKRTETSLRIAAAMEKALSDAFSGIIRRFDRRDLETGYEAFLLVDCDGAEAKRRALETEDSHPLGRLFDIDVIGRDGVPMSRLSAGSASRRCLLCGNDARVCMRLRSHSVDELTEYIQNLTDGYFRAI